VYRIFTNPFYAGILERDGKTYPGKHTAMITVDEFEKVQKILDDAVDRDMKSINWRIPE